MLDKRREIDLAMANLLVSTDFLKPHHLDKAYAVVRDDGKPLSHVLVDYGMVEQRLMNAALEVIYEVRAHRMAMTTARSVLFLMGNCSISIEEAMAKLGVVPVRNPWQSQLDAMADAHAHANA
jgi:hypothetical protein